MRSTTLALFLLVSGATNIWAQLPPPSQQAQSTPSPIVRDPHSNKDDLAVPLCPAEFNDSLSTDGVSGKADKGTRPPKPTVSSPAKFSSEARRVGRKQGIHEFKDVMSLLVGADGTPRETCIKESAGYGLDAEAAKAVMRYRFDPATNDGKPVPVRITVQVSFKLY